MQSAYSRRENDRIKNRVVTWWGNWCSFGSKSNKDTFNLTIPILSATIYYLQWENSSFKMSLLDGFLCTVALLRRQLNAHLYAHIYHHNIAKDGDWNVRRNERTNLVPVVFLSQAVTANIAASFQEDCAQQNCITDSASETMLTNDHFHWNRAIDIVSNISLSHGKNKRGEKKERKDAVVVFLTLLRYTKNKTYVPTLEYIFMYKLILYYSESLPHARRNNSKQAPLYQRWTRSWGWKKQAEEERL